MCKKKIFLALIIIEPMIIESRKKKVVLNSKTKDLEMENQAIFELCKEDIINSSQKFFYNIQTIKGLLYKTRNRK